MKVSVQIHLSYEQIAQVFTNEWKMVCYLYPDYCIQECNIGTCNIFRDAIKGTEHMRQQ